MPEASDRISFFDVRPLTDSEFSTVQKIMYDWAGIHLTEAKKALISGRLMKRLRHFNVKTYKEYLDIVLERSNQAERQTLIDLLTTNETYFFREDKHFWYLRDEILPRWKGDTFRVWSAAASTGAEPYTIAMLLADHFGQHGWEILGSDLNAEVLKEAADALYPIEEAQKIPAEYLKKYCLKGVRSQEGKFLIAPEIRKNVSFRQINLNETLPDTGVFDVIFLRNVMIYFNRETKKSVVEKLVQKLRPQGYLIVGHAESLHGLTDTVKVVVPTIYVRNNG